MSWPKGVSRKQMKESNTTVLEREPAKKQPAKRDFIVFNKPDIGNDEINAVNAVLRSGWLGTGPVVKEFEETFAKYLQRHGGSGYCVAVSSCTDALLIALKVLAVGDGAEVITTPLTFVATVNAILLAGAKPVFVDVDTNGNMDAEKIRFRVNNATKAILPVHLYGAACDMARIQSAAKSFELKVIDDCAHAFGGFYRGPGYEKPLGVLADISCFSFYANKNITSGEGGMLVTQRGDIAERMRTISMQGLNRSSWMRYGMGPAQDYEVMHEGIKGNMSDVHAAIGLAQLKRWDELYAERSKVWAIYEQAFGPKEAGHSKHIYTIRVKNRDIFRRKLWENGIGTGVHYRPLHLEPAFRNLGYKEGDLPMAEKIGLETVSLPVSATMSEEDATYVVETASRYMETV